MGDMMHTLYADQQSIERRAVPPVNEPATPAGKIIAAAAKAKQTYRCNHPDADTAMVLGVQIGYLNTEVRRLCAEIERLQSPRPLAVAYDTYELEQQIDEAECCLSAARRECSGYGKEPNGLAARRLMNEAITYLQEADE